MGRVRPVLVAATAAAVRTCAKLARVRMGMFVAVVAVVGDVTSAARIVRLVIVVVRFAKPVSNAAIVSVAGIAKIGLRCIAPLVEAALVTAVIRVTTKKTVFGWTNVLNVCAHAKHR